MKKEFVCPVCNNEEHREDARYCMECRERSVVLMEEARKPAMMLIDRDALEKKAITVKHFDAELGGVVDHQYVRLEDVLGAPTVDPIHAGGGCYCRECKYLMLPQDDEICCEYHDFTMWPKDGFCSFGEREEK